MKARWLAAATAFLLLAGGAWGGQKKTKQKKGQVEEAIPIPVPDQIDRDIGEMLGAWQVGDIDAMHKYYADDATWVSGAYAPPIAGWQNYVVAYQEQRKRISSVQLIRRNTNIFYHGDVAWACYQWEFDAVLDGRPTSAHGQTTLVFVHQGDRWLIVHNHTSEICPLPVSAPASPSKPDP